MVFVRIFSFLAVLSGCEQDEAVASAGTFPCNAQFCVAGEEVCVYDEDGLFTEGQDERVCVSSSAFDGCTSCDCLVDCYSCQETEVGAYCLIFTVEPP